MEEKNKNSIRNKKEKEDCDLHEFCPIISQMIQRIIYIFGILNRRKIITDSVESFDKRVENICFNFKERYDFES